MMVRVARHLAALMLAGLVCAPAAWAAGDVAAGEAKAQACSGCHGAKGVSSMPGVPSLAGQTDGFLQWQLVFFRTGRRNNAIMTTLASGLSDDDVKNLAAYFASLPPPPSPGAQVADAAPGSELAAQHHCAACHTEEFIGKGAAARLKDQREDYLVHALADYRSGARPSTGVAAMNEAASGLSDGDIAAVSHYLATLP